MRKLYNIAAIAVLVGLLSTWTGNQKDLAPLSYAPAAADPGNQASASWQIGCIDTLNITVDLNCQYTLSPKQLTTGVYPDCITEADLLIFVDDKVPGNGRQVDGCGYFRYVVQLHPDVSCATLDPCWGYIHAEDKTAPEIRLPVDVAFDLSCVRVDTVFNLPESLEFTDTAYVRDNCDPVERPLFDFYDEIVSQDQCDDVVIKRNFFAEDEKGNRTVATQTITLRRPVVSQFQLEPEFVYDITCAEGYPFPLDENGNIHPSVSGYPYYVDEFGDTLRVEKGLCGLTASYTDTRFEVCGNTYKLQRQWSLEDWCTDQSKSFQQLIIVGKVRAPEITFPADSIGFSTGPFGCNGVISVPQPEIEQGCSGLSLFAELYQVRKPFYALEPDTVFIQSLRVDEQGPHFREAPIGEYVIVVRTDDGCKHLTSDTLQATIVDKTAPIAKCVDDLQVSLDSHGFGKIEASNINEGSSDGCRLDSVLIRRLEIFEGINDCAPLDSIYFTDWQDEIYISCCDLMNSPLRVELRVVDWKRNDNICWTDVRIEDKFPPRCVAPADTVLNCDTLPRSFNYRDLAQLAFHFGLATAFDACDMVSVEALPILDTLRSCGFGTFTRRFIARDSFGNVSPICEQEVTIIERHNYEIRFPKDTTVICVEPEPDSVLVNELGCDLLAVSTDDEKLSANEDNCYKVFRTYRVINWCEYDGESPPFIVSRDVDCDGIPGDEDVWVIVRPDTTVYLDRNNNELDSIPEIETRPENCDGIQTNPYGFWYNTDTIPELVSNGFWEYTQIIKVDDNIPPQIFVEDTIRVCMDMPDCSANVVVSFNIIDECVEGTVTIETFFEDIGGEFVMLEDDPWDLVGRYPKYLMSGIIPDGRYRVDIIANDQCGNVTRVGYFLEIVDCKPPGIICHDDLTVELGQLEPETDFDGDGDADPAGNIVWVSDLLPSVLPNTDCTGPVTYSINRAGDTPDPNQKSLAITCDDPQLLDVEVYAWDSADNPFSIQPDGGPGGPNFSFCRTTIEVQDNLGSFCDMAGQTEIGGAVEDPLGVAVANVFLDLSGVRSQTVQTRDEGRYRFVRLEQGYDYTVSPRKEDNTLENVTTLDIIYITQHILGMRPFTSPYQWLAADVNRSASVTTLDMIQIRRAILSVESAATAFAGWRFVDARASLPGSGNPMLASIPEVININNLAQPLTDLNFVAVKVGDVSSLNTLRAGPLSDELLLMLENEYLPAGQQTELILRAEDLARFEGMQFALDIDPEQLEILEFTPSLLGEANLGADLIDRGILLFSWDRFSADAATGEEHLFRLRVKAKRTTRLAEAIRLAFHHLAPESYRDGRPAGLRLQWTQRGSTLEGLKIGKVFPNPTSGRLSVPIDLLRAGTVHYELKNLQGQLQMIGEWDFSAGPNLGELDLPYQATPGIYLLTIRTGGQTHTQKVVKY